MKKTLVTLLIAAAFVFATSAMASAENGPIWPTIGIMSHRGVK